MSAESKDPHILRSEIADRIRNLGGFDSGKRLFSRGNEGVAELLDVLDTVPASSEDITISPSPLRFGRLGKDANAACRRSLLVRNLSGRSCMITDIILVNESQVLFSFQDMEQSNVGIDEGHSLSIEVEAHPSRATLYGMQFGCIVLILDGTKVIRSQLEMTITSPYLLAFKFDVLAKPFVSDAVRFVNLVPLLDGPIPAHPPPGPDITFIANQGVPPGVALSPAKLSSLPVIQRPTGALQFNDGMLTIPTYKQHMKALLMAEMEALTHLLASSAMYATRIPYDVERTTQLRRPFAQIQIPGIMDDNPPLRRGDSLRVRCITPWDGFEYKAFIWDLQRRTQTIAVQISEWVVSPNYSPEALWNIQFDVDTADTARMVRAVEESVPHSWLFPEISDAAEISPSDRGLVQIPGHNLEWVDTELNWEQRTAVADIVNNKYGSVPYVVWGPPGTGKTKTIVEAVLQTLAEHANAHVLVTAPSHSATDTIVTRLSRHLPPSSLLRLNHHTRSFAETPSPLLPWTFIDPDTNTYFSIPPVSDILSRRVVACTCRDASLLVDVGAANSALEQVWREHHAWLRKTYPHIHKGEPPPWIPHWTHAFVDEAGQALEPEVVIPMTVVAAPKSTGRNLPSQFILCGDYRQLGPSIRSDLANSKGLGVSLLERIMATSLYKDHPTARGRTGSEGQSTVEALQNVVPPFQNLVRNYRSHPVILMEPSRIFYSDTLIPCANPNDTLSLLKWEGLPNPQLPLVFYGVRGEDEAMDVNDSWWNEAEVAAVVECVESLLLVSADERKGSAKGKQTGKVHPEHFGVIAPFREQVRRIRQVLRSKKLAGVNVGTVEDYQGMERRIVVLSCVRVREKYANEDKKRGVGVVLPGTWDGRRLNVALTRAKELLVVIGDPHMWKRDKHWSDLLQFALRNNLYRGAPLPFHFSAGGFASPELSALERQWRASQTFQAAPSLGSAVMQKGWHAKEMTLTPEHE